MRSAEDCKNCPCIYDDCPIDNDICLPIEEDQEGDIEENGNIQ